MDIGTVATVVGTDVAAISIIIVYHLFALQTWSQRGTNLLDESIGVSLTTLPDDFRREELSRRAQTSFEQFPVGQVVALGACVVGMCVFGIVTTAKVPGIANQLLIGGPVLLLAATYILSTQLIRSQGRKVLEQTRSFTGR